MPVTVTPCAALCLLMVLGAPGTARSQVCSTRVVSRSELLNAMREERGYNLVATTNWARFQTAVFLRIARWAHARDSASSPLLILAEDWFWNYLDVAELTPETAPYGTRRARELHQDMQLDYGPRHVIREVKRGPVPLFAMNVRISWPSGPDVPTRFSYMDTLSVPKLKVTSQQTITYRLVDFGDMVLYDELKGVSGRPTSGVLGALFSILGEGGLVESRMTISADGIQVIRARSKKLFTITAVVTVRPDGRGEKGVPDGNAALAALEERVKQPLDLAYRPYVC